MALVNPNRLFKNTRKIANSVLAQNIINQDNAIFNAEDATVRNLGDVGTATREVADVDVDNTSGGSSNFLQNVDLIGSALDIIPLGGALLSKGRADDFFDDARLKSGNVDFRLGQISDLTRPNFATPTRVPQGSSIAERTAAQKFGDIAQKGQEGAFEIENSIARERQREEILNRENRSTEFNTGRQDRFDAFNAQLDARQGATARNKQLQFETAALANASTRRSENTTLKSGKALITAAELLKNDDSITTWEQAVAKEKQLRKNK